MAGIFIILGMKVRLFSYFIVKRDTVIVYRGFFWLLSNHRSQGCLSGYFYDLNHNSEVMKDHDYYKKKLI